MTTTPPVSALVTWAHMSGAPAVCLGRVIMSPVGAAPVIVLSEIALNPDALGISGDFPAAATAAWTALAAPYGAGPGHVSWYAHHGPFSSYDPTGPETLTEVALTHDGASFHGDLDGHRLLTPDATQQLLNGWRLEPVTVALRRLGP